MTYCKHNLNHSIAVHAYFVVAIICCLICAPTNAQRNDNVTKAAFITSFPFTLLDGGTIILKATVGNKTDSLNFVLDTGCGGISLDSSTAYALGFNVTGSERSIIGLGQHKKGSFILGQSLHLPKLTVDSLDLHINDYTFLSESKGVKVDGIIGYSFLKQFIVKVDYDNLRIEVWKPGYMKYPKGGYSMGLYLDNMPMMEAGIKDNTAVNAKYFFDTGADLCFLLSERFVTDSNVFKKNKKAIAVPADGVGGSMQMHFTTLDVLHFGPYTFKKVPTYVFNDTYNVMRYPRLGGLIGNDLLHRFNLVINFPEAEIHLMPNSHFKERFDYNYTGFKIFNVNGKTIVNNLVKDSPAEKAGLQNGDLVIGVNNNFSNDLEEYKSQISLSRNTFKVSILRENQVRTIVVPVESVL